MKAVKLVLVTYYKQFHMKAIHFQICKTTAFSYFLKMGGNKNKYLLELAKEIWSISYTTGPELLQNIFQASWMETTEIRMWLLM